MYIFNSKIAISEFDDVLEPQRRILLAKPFIFASIVDFITDYSLKLDIFKIATLVLFLGVSVGCIFR